jgi:arylsulfatase A-like enzyme
MTTIHIMKRCFSHLLACLLFVGSLPAAVAPGERPNIVFIMSDDHAAHAISSYGSKINQTLNLDRIAKEGMRLANCFAVNSICTPSRATILTGKYSHKNGVPVFNRIDGSQPMVQKYLQKAGYYTGMIGKWHLGSDPTGFDYWNILPGQGLYHDPVFISSEGKKKLNGYATDLITDMAIEFVKNRPKEKPFFLCYQHKAPHRPWQPDAKHAHLYDDVTIPEPDTFDDDYRTRSSAATEATMRIGDHLTRADLKLKPPAELKPKEKQEWNKTTDAEMEVEIKGEKKKLSGEELKRWKYQKYIKDYLRCIASVDDNVGRFLDFLDSAGLKENTIVIYTSDQGFFLGDHGWFDKRFMYEESLRMPFLVRWPGKIKPGTVADKMILNVDFAPTFLDAAGAAAPPDMQGRSFLPILRGEPASDWRKSMYYRYYHYPKDHRVQPHYGVRTERHKLIYFNKIDQWELFDLQRDPRELLNVYAEPAYAETLHHLKTELERLRKQVDDRDQFANLPDKPEESVDRVAPDGTVAEPGK